MKTKSSLLILILCGSIITGCLPAAPADQSPETFYTAAAETIAATLTIGANLASLQTVIPSSTPEPVLTNTPMPVDPTATIALPTAEVILSPTPTQTALPGRPTIHATVNTNCREGPSSDWDIVSGLMVGDTSRVIGRLEANNWFLIVDPDDATGSCWVWSRTTIISGELSQIPIIPMPATPTPDLPIFTISASVSPAHYTGACPVDIAVSGSIKSDQATDVVVRFTSSFGYDFDTIEETFNKAGRKVFNDVMTITEDTDGFIRFRIYEPYEVRSDKVNVVVNCD